MMLTYVSGIVNPTQILQRESVPRLRTRAVARLIVVGPGQVCRRDAPPGVGVAAAPDGSAEPVAPARWDGLRAAAAQWDGLRAAAAQWDEPRVASARAAAAQQDELAASDVRIQSGAGALEVGTARRDAGARWDEPGGWDAL